VADSTYDARRARATLGACGGAHILHDGLHDALYVLLPLWSQAFGLSLVQVGLLKAAYSGAMALFQVPAGILAERYGERLLLAGGTIVTGIGYLLLGYAGGFAALLGLLVVVGLGAGVQHPLSSALVARAYEGGPRRAGLGIYNFTGDLGKIAIPSSVAVLAGIVGWQSGVIAFGAIGMVAGIVIYLGLRSLGAGAKPDLPAAPAAAPAGAQAANLDAAAPAETSGGDWGIHNGGAFFAISAINVIDTAATFGFLTFMPFLIIEKGAAVETVGLALALVFGGGAAGKFACGFMAERFGIIRTVVLTEILTGIGFLLVLVLPLGAILVALPLVGLAMNGTSSVLYASVADFVSPHRHSRGFALFYTLGLGAGAVSPPLFGLVSDGYGVPVALAIIGVMAFATLPFCPTLARSMARSKAQADC
jgi:MFS family permease